ncbi:MAG: tRNA pseudouridine(38-40) synthase TruA [Bryobacteraceae bacterium]
MDRRIRITLAYDGTDFHGWQVQPGLPTIQGELERVVSEIESSAVRVDGSGRTDAGVHALAQVAAFTLANPIPLPNLQKAINRLLPPSIRILDAVEVPLAFHPRYDATSKTYEYRIERAPVCHPADWRYVHHYPYPLDTGRMLALAPVFEGVHNFSAFASADDRDAEGGSKVRTVFSSRVDLAGTRLVYRVRGSGFLKHMVRNLAGTLIEAGKGNLDEAALRGLLAAPERTGGPTAPAKGLHLVEVDYS